MKVLCFGEFLLRLSPQLGGEWIRQAAMPVYVGGAELNAATALALWGVPVAYCSALPEHYLSREICQHLEEKNIDTRPMVFGGSRIGSYYLPQGTDLKNAGVIYDRAHSSFSELQPGQIDWDAVLQDVSWFHFSAISPALNASVAAVCKEALEAATQKGINISVDLNYRSKLWQWGKQPIDVMPDLVQHCTVVMGNIWAAEQMLNIEMDKGFDRSEKASCLEQAQKTSEAILQRFPQCRQVANTFRFDESGTIRYYATLYREGTLSVSEEHQTDVVVDKVGSGDTFMAGLIYGSYKNLSAQQTVSFAAAAAFNKLFITGDATTSSVADIQNSYSNYA